MPDFTQVVHFHCESVESFSTEVKGSTGRIYKVRVGYADWPGAATKFAWSCDCQSFKFRKTCKHIAKAKVESNYCGWQGFVHGGEAVRDEHNIARCPQCNGIAIAMRHAV
jgi:hypothetical protein